MTYFDAHGRQITTSEAALLQDAGHPVIDETGATVTLMLSEVPIDNDGNTEITRAGGSRLQREGATYGQAGYGTHTF